MNDGSREIEISTYWMALQIKLIIRQIESFALVFFLRPIQTHAESVSRVEKLWLIAQHCVM